ncbi:MAG: carboxypeptidase regulatory-like domain-containing protein [Cyanobacterium sp. T60_A2020_053]|nr:carboxypeptidase regulatory-like domain-containing protein [Cyanobacterium sp. T60_A2020_053]
MLTTFDSINPANVPNDAIIKSVISVGVVAEGTIIYYDHWEDGYEADLANPTQSTTQVWGDGDLTNGIAPVTMNDLFVGGEALKLESDITSNRTNANIFFDGRDLISATFPIAITRFAFPLDPGPVIAGATEIIETKLWGTNYTIPVGPTSTVGLPTTGGNRTNTGGFEATVVYVQAGEDNTVVNYTDFSNSANNVPGVTLNKGETRVFTGVDVGDTITSNKGIQAYFLAGDVGSTYELRWGTLIPRDDWSNDYISPVAEETGSTGFFFFNPNNSQIRVYYEGAKSPSGSFTINANSTRFIEIDTDSGAINLSGDNYSGIRFFTNTATTALTGNDIINASANGLNFYAFASIDADDSGQFFDWGFPLLPRKELSPLALVSNGQGNTGAANDPIGSSRSVVWASPTENAYLFVDFDGDGNYDYRTPNQVSRLDSIRFADTTKTTVLQGIFNSDRTVNTSSAQSYDPVDLGGITDGATYRLAAQGDEDMSGAIIIASSGFTGTNGLTPTGTLIDTAYTWGQDPFRSGGNDDFALDLGTLVLPVGVPDVNKRVVSIVNPDGSVENDGIVDQAGDIINYVITVTNPTVLPLQNIVVTDLVEGSFSLTLTGPNKVGVDGNPIINDPFDPNVLGKNQTFIYTGSYTVTQADLTSNGGGNAKIDNVVTVTLEGLSTKTASVSTPINNTRGAITGTVLEDIDNNNTGDTPISGVTITLLSGTSGATVVGTAITNASGFYSFDNLVAGTYRIRQTNLNATYFDVSDKDGGANLNQITVTVVAAQTNTGNNFIDERKGIISGNVKEDIDGNDSGDVNLSGVTVNLKQGTTVVATTTTDANGNYTFNDVINGSYTVEQVNLNNTYFDVSDTQAPNDSLINVTISSGQTSSGNNFVDERKGIISGNVKEDIDGNDSGDVNLSGVTVNLKQGTTVVATTTTDANGNYTFNDVINGSYTVEQVNLNNTYFDVSDTQAPNDSLINVTISTGQTSSGNNFVDERKGIISGTILNDANGDNEFDSGDTPISGVTLELLNGTNVIATATTDGDGDYSFEGIENGNYTIRQTQPANFDSVKEIDGNNDNLIAVTVSGGNDVTGQDFLEDLQTATISGTVLEDANDDGMIDGGDTPISGVTVELLDGTTVIATDVTDGNGNYSFEGIENGNYTIRQTQPAGFDSVTDVDGGTDNIIAVTVSGGVDVTGQDFLEDLQTATISGTVLEDRTGDGFSGDDVAIRNSLVALLNGTTVVATTRSDVGGNYSFTNLNAGNYSIVQTNLTSVYRDVTDIDGNGNGKSKIDVTLAGGDNLTGQNFLDLRLGSINGNVYTDTNRDGEITVGDIALQSVTVQLLSGTTVIAQTLTNSFGGYSFNNLNPGNYTVREVNLPDYDDVKDLDGGDPNNIAVALLSGQVSNGNNFLDVIKYGSISGTVFDDKGTLGAFDGSDVSLSGVKIELLSGTTVIASTTTDGSGNYSFIDLDPGSYTVRQTNLSGYTDVTDIDGGNANLINVSVAPDQDVTGRDFLDTVPLSSIFGSVFDDTFGATDNAFDGGDTPIAGVTITLSDGTNTFTAQTDANGDYSFTNLAQGTYTITQSDLVGYNSVTDSESDTTNPEFNTITVTLTGGSSTGNNFLDESVLGSIAGNVFSDTTYDQTLDGQNETPLNAVTVQLLSGTNVISSTTTVNGAYSFTGLNAGNYTVRQTNLPNFGNVADVQGANDNLIAVAVGAGQNVTGQNFLDVELGRISGLVFEDKNANNVYDNGTDTLITSSNQTIFIDLYDSNDQYLVTRIADQNGAYVFDNLFPDTYKVVQRNQPVGYNDGFDSTGLSSPQDIVPNSDQTDQLTGLTINPGTTLINHNFGEVMPVGQKNIINGTGGRDTITGTTGGDFITGLKGTDFLTGGGGDDHFFYNISVDNVALEVPEPSALLGLITIGGLGFLGGRGKKK